MKYLDYYKKAMKTGKLLSEDPNGLCYEPEFRGGDLNLFKLTQKECEEFDVNAYWGSGHTREDWGNRELRDTIVGGFTPLRQTIVLFLAAMNDEL